jgi:UDP-GlcNAc:undecaprenyl-phosphate GlcNAc-1-phosphate transferase
MLIEWLVFLVVYLCIGMVMLPGVIRFLIQHGVTAVNYKSENIPVGMGLFLGIMLIIYLLILKATDFFMFVTFIKNDEMIIMHSYILTLLVILFLGWLDDTIGDKNIKGFSGHWKRWKDDKIITTGLLKIGVTGLMASWMVIETFENVHISILRLAIIVLMTNAMNLLDLRPGRTLKAFFMLCTAIFIFGTWFHSMEYLLPVLIPALIIFRKDLKAKIMLGDTGANFLGFALGFNLSVFAPVWFQMVILVLLIAVHWIAARKSITTLIENHRILYWLDHWGRT